MKSLDIYESSLCPGCGRPLDVCAASTARGDHVSVDQHVCGFALARKVQGRITAWENSETGKRPELAPLTPEYDDGLYLIPRPSTAEELAELEIETATSSDLRSS